MILAPISDDFTECGSRARLPLWTYATNLDGYSPRGHREPEQTSAWQDTCIQATIEENQVLWFPDVRIQNKCKYSQNILNYSFYPIKKCLYLCLPLCSLSYISIKQNNRDLKKLWLPFLSKSNKPVNILQLILSLHRSYNF